MDTEEKLERLLAECEELLNQEIKAIEEENLEVLEVIAAKKTEAIDKLTQMMDTVDTEPLGDSIFNRVQGVQKKTQTNSKVLADWMDRMDKEMVLLSRGRNRLKGVRHSYVTVPREGYLDRSRRFEA
ncbi:MAG: hypothetical protein HN675_03025 [Opitutae bacterium]|nr:hypothetical protein [Opitutae bacterium]MBT5381127.1 hypothetical protein [Opitutae bacterium]MBT5690529.1 hypothetical protein [Opitutae bacterium]MBT7852269.1 hypothetical protein [Opitutae bacterium]